MPTKGYIIHSGTLHIIPLQTRKIRTLKNNISSGEMLVAGKCMFFLRTLFQHCFICRPLDSIVTGMLEKKQRLRHCLSHRKKRFTSFPSTAGMSLTKLPLGRKYSVMTSLFPPRESLVVTSRLGTGNLRTFFLRCGKKVATSALSVRRSYHSARSHSQRWMLTIIGRSTSYLFYGVGIYTLIPGWLVSPDQSEIRCSDFLYIPNLTHSIKAYTQGSLEISISGSANRQKMQTDIHKQHFVSCTWCIQNQIEKSK